MPADWIDQLVTRLPNIRQGLAEEVRTMPVEELQRRVLVQADWIGGFSHCLDGIPSISLMPGAGVDGCRGPKDIRQIVLNLITEGAGTDDTPIDWARATLEIRKAGLSLDKASVRCGRDKSWLGHVSRGEVTRIEYREGIRLLKLHKSVCGDEAHAALLKGK